MPLDVSERLLRSTRGTVAVIFALALLPMVGMVGAAVEYSRATNMKTHLQSAVDASALAAGRLAISTGANVIAAAARREFDSNFKMPAGASVGAFQLTQTAEQLDIVASASFPALFGGVLGIGTLDVSARAAVALGANRLEIALVLDNTGSMAALSKMSVLKQAATSLVDTVMQAKAQGNEVFISVVPFNTQVKTATSNNTAAWLRFTMLDPDPKMNASAATWDGCIADRDKPLNTATTLPTGASATNYPAVNCQYGGLSEILPLSTDANQIKTVINSMNPTGNTNTVIGLNWGVNTLTPLAPLSNTTQVVGRRVIKSIVFLTDGLNTEDRFSLVPADIDASMATLCASVRPQNINVYTIRVIEGNETMLRNCATDPSMYYNAVNAAQLLPVFKDIAARLATLRLTM